MNNLLCNPSATEVDVEQEVDFGVLLGREHVGHALRVVPELKFLSQIIKDCDKHTKITKTTLTFIVHIKLRFSLFKMTC